MVSLLASSGAYSDDQRFTCPLCALLDHLTCGSGESGVAGHHAPSPLPAIAISARTVAP